MLDILFWFLYVFPLLVLFLLSKKGIFSIFKISIANVLVLFYLISNHFGLATIYNNGYIRSGEIAVNHSTLILLVGYNNIVVFLFVLTGIFFSKYYSKPKHIKIVAEEKLNLLPFLFILPILLFFSLYKFMDASPLQLLLAGDVKGATIERISQVSENRTSILGIKHSYVMILFEICSYIIILLLIAYNTTKNRIILFFLILYLLVFILFNISNVAKGVFLLVFYYFIFVYAQMKNDGNLFIKKFLLYLIPFFILLVYISFWTLGSADVDFFYPFERLLIGNLEPQYAIVNYYGFHNLLYGLSAPSFFTFWNHTQIDINFVAWQLLGLGEGLDGLSYTAPFSFVGEAHANFHVFGVILVSILVFTFFRILDLFVLKIQSSLVRYSLLIYLSLHYSNMSITGALSYLVDYYLWGVLIFIFIIYPNIRIKGFSIYVK
jgi:hypothetical protein